MWPKGSISLFKSHKRPQKYTVQRSTNNRRLAGRGNETLVRPISLITVRNSSCGKVVSLQACVKNSVHGGVEGCILACTGQGYVADTPLGRCPSLGRHPPPSRHTLGRHPRADTPPPDSKGVRVCSIDHSDQINASLVINLFNSFQVI